MPIGVPVTFTDGWTITVVSTVADGAAAIQAENQFNDPPTAGNQFFIATVSATYNGAASETFDGTYSLRAVGSTNVGYSTFENSCGVIPDALPGSEVFPGGTVQGNVCWEIVAADAAALTMYYDPAFDDTERVYWDLVP